MEPAGLPDSYWWRQGTEGDRALLLTFARITYRELFPQDPKLDGLSATVRSYFGAATPLWWVHCPVSERSDPVGLLWLGAATDPASGERYWQVLLLYVCPNYRRQGIGTALVRQAEAVARARGDRRVGLQVLSDNQPALGLYKKLGYRPQALQLMREIS